VAKGERVIVWAHNIHVSRDYVEVDVPGTPKMASMHTLGQFLATDFGDKMVSVGFSFSHGAYPDSVIPPAPSSSVDGTLAAVGKPIFMIDFRKAPAAGPVRTWLETRNRLRALGGMTRLVPARAYDAMVFVDTLTPAVPTPAVRARLQNFDRTRFSTRTTF
jgi:erythromycin esterase